MSKSKHAVELCALLVDETYGELSSRIFTVLLRRGRQPLKSISMLTRLTLRQIRHGLAVLIQQNLVYHCTENNSHTTFYEANHDTAYALSRSGKILEIVESRYGDTARDAVQTLFEAGNMRIFDLEKVFEGKLAYIQGQNDDQVIEHGPNGVNGHGRGYSKSMGQLHAALVELLRSGFVQPVTAMMFKSPTDTYNEIEAKLVDQSKGRPTGNKQKDELKALVRQHLQALRDESPKPVHEGTISTKQRPHEYIQANGINGNGKRRRLSNGMANGDHAFEDDGKRLDLQLTLRINYEKCTVALRTYRLVELAKFRIGETTARVYGELLRILEDKIPRCRLDPKIDDIADVSDGPFVTTLQVSSSLDLSLDVGSGIGKSSDNTKVENLKKRKADIAEPEGYLSEEEEVEKEQAIRTQDVLDASKMGEDDYSLPDVSVQKPSKRPKVTFEEELPKSEPVDRRSKIDDVKSHLQLLASDSSCKFLVKQSDNGQGEWGVDFEGIIHHLQEVELDQMILENFGKGGHRLARMLRKLGKVEEKQLPNLAFMKQKDIRTKLAEMQMAGMVDIQEVPRDNGRTTARTIFLWYFDTNRVSAIFLDSIYKCMSRCLQRLELEKRRAHDILSIMDRQDVIAQGGRAEDHIEGNQLNQLHDIQRKEERLLLQLGRLDGLVGIFRDF